MQRDAPTPIDERVIALVEQAFPIDATSVLSVPVEQLDPSRRALLSAALAAKLPGLAADALEEPYTWTDIGHWIASAPFTSGQIRPARVSLRVVGPDDFPALYMAAMDPETGDRWRYRGATIGFDRFVATFHDDVLCQFGVRRSDDHTLLGLVATYNADLSNGHAYLGFMRSTPGRTRGGMTEGLALMIDHVFGRFAVRQLYAEVPDHNAPLFDGVVRSGLLEPIGYYPEHAFSRGAYTGYHIYRLTRQAWTEHFAGWDLGT